MIREDVDKLMKLALLEDEKELADKLWATQYETSALGFLCKVGVILRDEMEDVKSEAVKEASLNILSEIRKQWSDK